MLRVTVCYDGMCCKTFDNITKIFCGDIGGTKEITFEQICGHHLDLCSDLWLHSDKGVVNVRTNGLHYLEVQQE